MIKFLLKWRSIISWGILLFPFLLYSQYSNRFTKLKTKDGLSQNTINVFFQDSNGFMWIGTNDGLNKYDGYEFTVFKTNLEDESSITNNNIMAIVEDDQRNLWIGTNGGGLNKYNLITGQFSRFYDGIYEQGKGVGEFIQALFIDSNKIWVSSSDKGLSMINLATGKSTSYTDQLDLLGGVRISSFGKDKLGNLWMMTNKGPIRYLGISNAFKHYNLEGSKGKNRTAMHLDVDGEFWVGLVGYKLAKYNYSSDSFELFEYELTRKEYDHSVTSISEDQNGNLYLGTWDGGVVQLNKTTKKYRHFLTDPNNSKSLSLNLSWLVFVDQENLLWVGTNGGGINKLALNKNGIHLYEKGKKNEVGLIGNSIRAIYENEKEELWVGTYGGLNKINRKTNEIKHIPYAKGLDYVVYSMLNDPVTKDILWMGTEGDGLVRFNMRTGMFQSKHNIDQDPDLIFSIDHDSKGNLWLGCSDGLYKYSIGENKYEKILKGEGQINNQLRLSVYKVFYDNGLLWLGTKAHGLIRFNTVTGEQKNYTNLFNNTNSIGANDIKTIYRATNGTLWIGTNGGGLNKYNSEKDNFLTYTVNDGLPNNVIYGILEDHHENLWLSTNNGISKFNPTTNVFRNFTVADGLQDQEFNTGAYFKNKKGELYFGGVAGLNRFYPDSVTLNNLKPQLAITSLKNYGRPVSFLSSVNDESSIKLNYEENELEFEFAALSFTAPELNQYAYKLDGVDKDWVYSGSRRFVTYSHLAPGNYVFKVKGSNSYGIWNETGITLPIMIKPPIWATTWFFALLTVLFMGLIFFIIFKVRIKQVELKAAKEYYKMENEQKAAIIKEIHHRIKNNLGVVNSLLKLQSREIEDENIVTLFKEAQSRVLSMALLHEKMYRSENLEHIEVKEHIELLVEDIIQNYAVNTDIELDIRIDNVEFGMRTLVPLGLIINEIITNALKYAFEGRKYGILIVWLKKMDKENYVLTIGDNGIGIIESDTETKGIGKKLIKSFIRQLQGTIARVDKPGTVYEIAFKSID